MSNAKIQVVSLLILLNVNLFRLSFGNKDDASTTLTLSTSTTSPLTTTTTVNNRFDEDEETNEDVYYDIGRDPPSTNTTTATTTTTEVPIYIRKPCGFTKYCVKHEECGSRTGKIIIELDRPENYLCHYLETCCEESEIKKSPSPREVNSANNQCGITNVDGLFMTVKSSGNETSFAEYPFVVAILDSASNPICNGVLISHTVVLSAASCFPPNETMIVRAGDWDLLTDNEIVPHEDRLVKKTIVHKKFILSDFLYNLALAVLESAFPRTRHIVPVCKYDDLGTSILNTSCFAVGWNVFKYAKFPPERNIVFKMDVDTTKTSKSDSDGSIKSSVSLSRRYNFKGSPLICPNERNQYFVVGIWSYMTDEKNQPVFANVTRNREWINEHLMRDGEF
ncbi:hypothetical protein KR026_008429 [Drosophila bipectinata]|nr:hypothetical protein KR026_008429 [Drosophila bipectinata]